MLISLLVLSRDQIIVAIWVNIYGSFYRKPISLLEPLVVLIGRHKGYAREKFLSRRGSGRKGMVVGAR